MTTFHEKVVGSIPERGTKGAKLNGYGQGILMIGT